MMCSARRTTRRERFEKASAEDEHPVEVLAPDGAHYVARRRRWLVALGREL